MAANIQTTVFCNVMLCTSEGGDQYFIGISATVLRVNDSGSIILYISRRRQAVLSFKFSELIY
jgi:hypothetical protein